MQRVRDIDGKADSAPALPVLVPVCDYVADKFQLIHALVELRLDVVAGLDRHPLQIWISRRINARPYQIFLLDQLLWISIYNFLIGLRWAVVAFVDDQ